jgi:hypothetical protein
VLSRQLAAGLRDAGLVWTPATGDRFVTPDHGVDELELVVGDTRAASDALWLPREDQLRGQLGEAFIGLEHIPGETPGYAVSMLLGDSEQRYVDVDVESAYARAVLALLRGAPDQRPV